MSTLRILSSPLLKNSAIYTIASVLNSGTSFFLMPVLTRYLSPEEYGIISMFLLVFSIFNIFSSLNIHGAINRVYFEENINFKEYVGNCFLMVFLNFVFFFTFIFLTKKFISNISHVPEFWILLAAVSSMFQAFILMNLSILQAKMRAKNYAFVQMAYSLLNIILTLILTVEFYFAWKGRLIAQFLSSCIIGIYSLVTMNNYLNNWKLNVSYIRHALKFSLPLIPHTLGGMLMIMTDRFIISNLLGLKEVGIYTVGLQIGLIIQLIGQSFNKAYAPWLFNELNKKHEDTKVRLVKFTYTYFFAIILFATIIGLLAPLLVRFLVGKDFYTSSSIVLWIALGGAFNSMYYMVTNYIFYSYKTQFLALITFFCGLMNIWLTYLFTRYFGIVGAAFSYSLISLIFFILTFILSIKVYKMPWFSFIRRV